MNPNPTNLTVEDKRKGARAINRPEGLALRLIQKWPSCTDQEKAVVRSMLRPLMKREPRDGVT